MGARSTYTFTGDASPELASNDYAHVYLHWGGVTREECEGTLLEFLLELARCPDPRADDASYLAAKFVAWQAEHHRSASGAVMDFLSVGLMPDRMEGADYGAVICCGDIAANGMPATYTAPDTRSMDAADYTRFAFG